MSVRIDYKNGESKEFCEDSPLAEQLEGANHVHITVKEDYGKSAESFLKSVIEVLPIQALPAVNVTVEKEDMIIGAKIAKNAKGVKKNLALFWLIREMVQFQKKIDTQLSDIVKEIKERTV